MSVSVRGTLCPSSVCENRPRFRMVTWPVAVVEACAAVLLLILVFVPFEEPSAIAHDGTCGSNANNNTDTHDYWDEVRTSLYWLFSLLFAVLFQDDI